MAYDTTQLDSVLQGLQGQLQKPQGILGQLDPMKLALAQGFFAPTKTGGFGESVSNALGSLQGPLKTMADQNSSIQDKILQIKLAQAKLAGTSPEDREDRRDARMETQNQLRTIDSDMRMAQLGLRGLEAGSPEHTAAMEEIRRLQAERNALVNRKGGSSLQPPAQPQPQAQSQYSMGQVVTQNGKKYKITGITNGQITSAEEVK